MFAGNEMKLDNEALPLIIYGHVPFAHIGQCDCDCACTLDLPSVLTAQSPVTSFDCDCACALEVPRKSTALADDVLYQKAASLLSIPLEAGWQVNFNPVGPVGVTLMNRAAQQVLAAFDSPLALAAGPRMVSGMSPVAVRDAVAAFARIGLVHPVSGASVPAAQAATLSAWLHVTEVCNLDCPYCYVQKRPDTMSEEVGRAAVDRLVEMADRYGYARLKLKYAGGEPTLNFPLIQRMHARALERTAEAGLALEEVVLSNGVGVADAVLDFIAAASMRLMISLDGGPDSHDLVRARRDGRSTYAAVVDTVERAMARGLRPNISITLAAPNLEGANEAVAFALERELPFNLNFYRECALPGPERVPVEGRPTSRLLPDPARLAAAMLDIFGLISRHPTYPWPLTGIVDRARFDAPHSYPCSAGRDYLVVDAGGRVSACQMLLDAPWSNLSDEDPMATIRRRGERIFSPAEASPVCRACAWRSACSGGCPLMRNTRQHDDYCQVYQALFPELLKLEGARLLACQP